MNARSKAAARAVTKLLDRQRRAVRNEDPDRTIYKGVEQLLLHLTSLNARRIDGHPTPPPGMRVHADLLWLLDAIYGAEESRAGSRGESLTMDRASALVMDATAALVMQMLVIANAPTEERCSDAIAQLNTISELLRMIKGKLRSGDEQ